MVEYDSLIVSITTREHRCKRNTVILSDNNLVGGNRRAFIVGLHPRDFNIVSVNRSCR